MDECDDGDSSDEGSKDKQLLSRLWLLKLLESYCMIRLLPIILVDSESVMANNKD